MSMVAKYTSAFAGSALVSAAALAAVSGPSAAMFSEPFYWIMAVSLGGLASLCLGNGIGGTEARRREQLALRGLTEAGAALPA